MAAAVWRGSILAQGQEEKGGYVASGLVYLRPASLQTHRHLSASASQAVGSCTHPAQWNLDFYLRATEGCEALFKFILKTLPENKHPKGLESETQNAIPGGGGGGVVAQL